MGRVPASAPASVEDAAPGLVADALIFAAREEQNADAAEEEEEDTPEEAGRGGGGGTKSRRGSESPGAEGAGECLRKVCARDPRRGAAVDRPDARRARASRGGGEGRGDAGALARVAGAAERVVVGVAARVASSNGLRTDFGRAAGALAEALGEAAEALARRDAPGAGRAAKAARRAKRALLESVEAR